MAESRERAMARNERYVVAKRPQLRDDGIDELVMIAAREIGPPDRALKEDIANRREL